MIDKVDEAALDRTYRCDMPRNDNQPKNTTQIMDEIFGILFG